MNKRADVPVLALVLGTFAICSLALLSFYASDVKISNSFDVLAHMEKINSKIIEKEFYESQGFSEEEIKDFLSEEDFYYTEDSLVINETETDFRFAWSVDSDDWLKEKLSFSVEFFRN